MSFADLHRGPGPLLLPDGARHSRAANLALARALRPLDCYLSVDVEDGYSDDPDDVAAYITELGTDLDVDGVNLEDSTAESLIDPELHARKVAATKARVPGVFLNARVDTYWLGQEATVEATLARARRYVEAGADGVFVPGVSDLAEIEELAAAIDVPLNVLAVPGVSSSRLGACGVRRVSTGSLPYRAALQQIVGVAEAVRDGADLPAAVPYTRLQDRLTRWSG